MVSAYQCAAMQTPSNAVCRACEVSLVRLQDAIVVTSSGAETLPFLASFQLPASLAFFVIYGRIIDLLLLRSTTFALVVAPLLAAYAGFALFLYPAADLLHPHGFTAALAPMLPVGLHGLLKVSHADAQQGDHECCMLFVRLPRATNIHVGHAYPL